MISLDMDVKERIYEELSPFYAKTKNEAQVFKGINTIGQDILRYIMQPASGRFSALVQGRPGSGKTRCTLGIVDAIVQLLSTGHKTSRPPIILLTYNIDIFMAELKMHHQHGLINEFESLYKQMTKTAIDEDDPDDYSIGLSYYRMYGYKSFENLIFNGTLKEKDKVFANKYPSWGDEFEEMEKNGEITINEEVVRKLEGCIIIADEIHEAHARGLLNRGGLVISYLMQRLKNISLVISDATPISRLPIEIISIANMMLGTRFIIKDLFMMKNGMMVPNRKCFDVMIKISESTYMLEQPDTSSCPSIIFEGEKLNVKGFDKCMNYIKCELTEFQMNMINEHCTNQIMRRAAEIAILWDGKKILDGKNVNAAVLRQIYPDIPTCIKYSCKLTGLDTLLFGHKLLYKPGMTVIFTSLVIPPGSELIKHYLKLAGWDEFDEPRQKGNLCLVCQSPHGGDDHVRMPVRFGHLNKSISPIKYINTFRTFYSDENQNGDIIKALIVTNCVGVGVSLRETQRFVVFDQMNSVPREIQFDGRFDRPGSIKNPLGENILRKYQLMVTYKKEETYEMKYAQQVHMNWLAVRPMLEFILNRARMIEFADMSTPGTRFIDGPTFIKRKNYYSAKELYEYHRYKVDNTDALARLAKIKVKPHSDILITSAELRVTISGVVIKTLLMMVSTITIPQIMHMIKKHPPLMNYNVSNLTSEDFYIFGHIINQIGIKMTMPILNEIATESNNSDDYNKLLMLLMKSPTSPWSINVNNKLMKICFHDGLFYYTGIDDVNIDPKYRPYIFHNEIFKPIDIAINMQEYNREEHLRQIFNNIQTMRDDEPILNLITRIPQVILNTLLTMILLGNKFDKHPRLKVFIQLLESMLMIVPNKMAESILSKKIGGDYPFVYFNKSYHMLINGHLADVDIKTDLLSRKEADIKLQLVSDKDIMRIRLYNNAKQDQPKKEGKRIQRGIEIYSNNTSAIVSRLQTKQSDLGDELVKASSKINNQLKYKEYIVDHICKLQLKHRDTNYVDFIW